MTRKHRTCGSPVRSGPGADYRPVWRPSFKNGFAVDLNIALAKWQELLGDGQVLSTGPAVDDYAYSTLPTGTRAAAVLIPDTADQVPAIVRIASDHGVPLYPISRGRNWGYGDACAVGDGQVIVDLGRLNRILEINEELAYAVIEPGVSQGQLSNYLRDNGIPLWLDCTGAGPDASIVGNILERGFGHTPYGNRTQTVCGMEIVLADGRLLKTGFGHYPKSASRYVFPYGIGPSLDGLFVQSGLGIVTRVGIWLMPEPEHFAMFLCSIRDHDDLGPVVDALRPLRLDGTLRSVVHIGNDLRLISGAMTFPHTRAPGATHLSADLTRTLRTETGTGAWTVAGGLFGRRQQVNAAKNAVRRALRGPGRRLTFIDERTLNRGERVIGLLGGTGIAARLNARLRAGRALFELNKGRPSARFLAGAYWRRRQGLPASFPERANPAADNCGLLWLSPVIPMTGRDALDLHATIEPIFRDHGFDPFITLSMVTERCLGAVLTIAYDREDAKEVGRAMACYRHLFSVVMDSGRIPYRVGIQSMADLTQGSDGVFWPLISQIKGAIDPAGILSPGRYDPLTARRLRS